MLNDPESLASAQPTVRHQSRSTCQHKRPTVRHQGWGKLTSVAGKKRVHMPSCSSTPCLSASAYISATSAPLDAKGFSHSLGTTSAALSPAGSVSTQARKASRRTRLSVGSDEGDAVTHTCLPPRSAIRACSACSDVIVPTSAERAQQQRIFRGARDGTEGEIVALSLTADIDLRVGADLCVCAAASFCEPLPPDKMQRGLHLQASSPP